jgi:hypothetical protein
MIKDLDGLPLVGTRSKCLGVRTSGDHPDVHPDAAGWVLVNRKGLSVSADWRTLPGHLIPKELNNGLNGARGIGMAVFVHGDGTGAFAEGPVAEGLELYFKQGRTDRGEVGPTVSVPLAQYQSDLQATRAQWMIERPS